MPSLSFTGYTNPANYDPYWGVTSQASGRYTDVSNGAGGGVGGVAGAPGTTTNNTTSNTSRTGTQNTANSSNTSNMSAASQAALEALIQQLQGGGTAAMQADRAARNAEISTLQTQRQGYDKNSAFTDAAALMDQQRQQALAAVLPGITRAAEGAGTSRNSMRALLLQKEASQAAQSAAVAGLKTATDYGNISNQMSNVLASLIGQNDPASTALLSALNISKGAVSNTNSTSNVTSADNTNTNSNSVTVAPIDATGSSRTSTGGGGGIVAGGVIGGGVQAPTGIQSTGVRGSSPMIAAGNFNPVAPDGFTSIMGTPATGTDASNMMSRAGGTSDWVDSYQF